MNTYDEAEEAESDALHSALSRLCTGKRSIVIISALTNLLANVVTTTALTHQGVDSFAIIFTDELRRRWVDKVASENGKATAEVDG